MNLGKLTLYAQDGLMYTDELFSTRITFEQHERSLMEFATADTTVFNHIETKFEFSPVSIKGTTEYITGNFKTSKQLHSETAFQIWLLVEEEIEEPIEDQPHG